MQLRLLIISSVLSLLACNTDKDQKPDTIDSTTTDLVFDHTKWNIKEGEDYPFRDQMFKDVVYNDTIRDLNRDELLKLLGNPDRIEDGHLYYIISQKRLGSWPLHTKTMVVKLKDDNTIEWIKYHE